MRKELFRIIEIPAGVEVSIDENVVIVKGPEGELSRKFGFGRVEVSIEGNELKIGNKSSTKKEKKIMNTLTAHLNNMIKGVQEKFVYDLKICSGHFPMTVKKEGDKIIVKNFLGEKVQRSCKVVPGVDVEINKNEIIITSLDKELAGQAAANLESITKIKGRDKRIFQDGIYITKKAGKAI